MFPDSIEEMAPLFAAVLHGCLAGNPQEALDKIYWLRICREDDHFTSNKLGAFGSEAAVLSAFFDPPWERLATGLRETDQSFILGEAGYALRALGRLPEATELMRLSLQRCVAQKEWENAANVAANLSELLQTRGELTAALTAAQQSVEFSDTSRDESTRLFARATLAATLHSMGRRDAAAAQFGHAERMQKENQPTRPMLYASPGFRYCNLLLEQGLYSEVLDRATRTLKWARAERVLLNVALDHLSLGRAHLCAAQRGDGNELASSTTHLQQAVDGLRGAGHQDELPFGLLARAMLHIYRRDFPAAHIDLAEALGLAIRCGFRLHEADAHLSYARLQVASDNIPAAREHRDSARAIIDATGYHRRDGALAEFDAALLASA
jgi:tetratricopeptide (TPR) repeat protein